MVYMLDLSIYIYICYKILYPNFQLYLKCVL